jgi:hypothetical protein
MGSKFTSDIIYKQKYNQLFHDVDLYLDNSGDFDNPKRYHINPAAVISLEITDIVTDWVTKGSLTFLYVPEPAPQEQAVKTGQGAKAITGLEKGANENGNTLNNYQFRGDGYDLLRVCIIPNTKMESSNSIAIDRNDTKWMLSYVFSIYDVEDINDIPNLKDKSVGLMKCLRLSFHDIRYQMLRTANIEYSTSTPKDPEFKPNFDSEIAKKQGVLYTGDILRDIFNEVLAKKENGGDPEFKVEAKDWEKGKGEMFYTSPAQYSAEDDLDYIYSNHVSETELKGIEEAEAAKFNDLSIIHTNRGKEYGAIEPIVLTPLTSIFQKAGKDSPGEYQKEHFFIPTQDGDSPIKLYKAPVGGNKKDIDLQTYKYGEILSYSFVDMAAITNSESFRTTPVYSVDIKKREFNIEFKGHDIKTVKKVMSKSYISEMFKKTSDEEAFLPTIHKNKKDLNVFPTFSLNGNNSNLRQKNGLHNLLYTGIFHNACVCFKALGLTLRESGTFIAIDEPNGSNNSDFFNKLYGQWFVIRVDHIFQGENYVNMIYAVKLHRFEALQSKFGGLYEV